MGGGMFLLVVGAILAFAVDDDLPGIDLNVTGLILMLAGAAAIAWARRGSERERVVTTTDTGGLDGRRAGADPLADIPEPIVSPSAAPAQHVVHEVVRERGPEPHDPLRP